MRTHRWALALLAGAVSVMAGAGRAPAQAPAAPAKPAAVVNGEPISLADVDLVIKRQGPTAIQPTDGKLRDMRMTTLSMLIDDLLQAQYLRQNGPRIDKATLDKAVTEYAEGLKKNGKTMTEFLKELGQTDEEFRQDMTNVLQWQAYVQARLHDEDVKRFYDENKDFFDGVTVRVSHIVLRVAPGAPEAEQQKARNKLLAVRQEIVSGKTDFAEAAKKNSQCASAPNGGDLGYIQRKFMVEEPFARAAFALQPGQISDVVQTDYGLHLIKVTDRKAGKPSDFNAIKDKVFGLAVMELRANLLMQLRKTAKVEINLP
jgi:peptidyl-prolyl cis-trans isomerase C